VEVNLSYLDYRASIERLYANIAPHSGIVANNISYRYFFNWIKVCRV